MGCSALVVVVAAGIAAAAAGKKKKTCDEVKLVTVVSAPDGIDDWYADVVAVSPDGNVVVVSGNDNDGVYVYEKDGALRTAVDSPAPGNYFGESLDVSGDVFVAGAYLDDDAAEDAGAVYVYETTGDPITKILPSDLVPQEFFGQYNVGIDDDVLVACSIDIKRDGVQGRALAYQWDGVSWNFVQTLIPVGSPDGRETLNVTDTGSSVAISKPFIAVGSDYFFDQRVLVWYTPNGGASWIPIQEIENPPDDIRWNVFGTQPFQVAISSTFLVIGATQEFDDDGDQSNFGVAYVYTKDTTNDGMTWSFLQKLEPTPTTIPSNDHPSPPPEKTFVTTVRKATYVCEVVDDTVGFGKRVATAGDYIIVAAEQATYVYKYDGNRLSLLQKLLLQNLENTVDAIDINNNTIAIADSRKVFIYSIGDDCLDVGYDYEDDQDEGD